MPPGAPDTPARAPNGSNHCPADRSRAVESSPSPPPPPPPPPPHAPADPGRAGDPSPPPPPPAPHPGPAPRNDLTPPPTIPAAVSNPRPVGPDARPAGLVRFPCLPSRAGRRLVRGGVTPWTDL